MAELKNTTITEPGFIKMPVGTTAQRPATPLSGFVRYNSSLSTIEYYQNNSWYSLEGNPYGTATGAAYTANIVDNGTAYKVHVFTGNGTFNCIVGGLVEYLILAGGGGGSANIYDDGAGGGAGGLLEGETYLNSGSYPIIVGTGGGLGSSGNNSSALGLAANGGGPGAGHRSTNTVTGGSGGGSGGAYGSTDGGAGTLTGGPGIDGQGNRGGGSVFFGYAGAGGGGATQTGFNSTYPSNVYTGGAGGRGKLSTITGYPVWYAGGGGGYGINVRGSGGLGGGGAGSQSTSLVSYPGAENLGGGGGGGKSNVGASYDGKAGGSGLVVIRYRTNEILDRPEIHNQNLILHYDFSDGRTYSYGTNPDNLFNLVNASNGTRGGNLTFSGTHGGIFSSQTYPAFATTSVTVNNLREYTLSVWVKKTTTQEAFLVLGTRFGNNTDQALAIRSDGKLCLHKYNFSSSVDLDVAVGTTNLNDSNWHYCVITYQNGVTRSYVDGVLEGTGTHVNTTSNSNTLLLNYDSSVNQTYRHYIGFYGDVLVYNRALSDSSILQNFQALRGKYGI